MKWPLGTREGLHTGFKRADALKDPGSIAREAVAFLNAEGGEIWIGFGETDGVADSVEAISNPDQQGSRLRDVLVDLIEPSPSIGDEVEVEVVPFPADARRGVILLTVKKGKRAPYALLRQGARTYLVRTGGRVRTLSREELAHAFAGEKKSADKESKAVEAAKAEMIKWSSDLAGLKLTIRPVEHLELQLSTAKLRPLLQDAHATGNRPLGWTFVSQYSDVKPTQHGFRFGDKNSVQLLEIQESGEIEFSAGLERLQWKGAPNEIWPFTLFELPASVLRLARVLYKDHVKSRLAPHAPIVVALSVFGIRDWLLGPYSPDHFAHSRFSSFGEDDSFLGEPIVQSWKELEATPDRTAYRLIRQVYRAFGYEEEMIPAEYNREAGQLTFQA